jgi:hypothetical protein
MKPKARKAVALVVAIMMLIASFASLAVLV